MKKTLLIISLTVLLASCATVHTGMLSTSSINKPVKYVDIAYGVAQTNRYFGFGGNCQDALVLEARRNLIKNRPLKPNEEYANITVDFKSTYWPFYIQNKATLCADVVRFSNDTTSDPYTETYKNKLLGKLFSNDLFSIGDSIVDEKFKQGVVVSFEDNDNVRIVYKTSKDKFRTKIMPINKIYTTNKSYKGHKVGDIFYYPVPNSNPERKTSGKIMALGLNSLIIKDYFKNTQFMSYQ